MEIHRLWPSVHVSVVDPDDNILWLLFFGVDPSCGRCIELSLFCLFGTVLFSAIRYPS